MSFQPGWILSSFFFGYLVTQIPGGWLAERYGGRWIFGIGIVMTAVFTLFTPLAAYWHIGALIAVRVAEGFFEVSENVKSRILGLASLVPDIFQHVTLKA